MKIFVCVSLTAQQLARLAALTDGANLRYHPETDAAARLAFSDCDVAFGNPPADWLAEARGLQWVQLESVGFGEYTSLGWQDLGQRLRISNLAGFFSQPVAETILAGILSHYRGVGALALLQDRKEWLGDAVRPTLRTLQGADVVLVGLGDINRRVADLLMPFNCQITGIGRNWTSEALDGALAKADITICAVPHTDQTRNLFDRRRIGGLRPGSLLVNFGRGSLVDEHALADALESGALGGAVIDVTQDEPLPQDHRFWKCRNMLLTQHTGGGTGDEVDRKIDVFIANLARLGNDEPPSCLVELRRGY